MPLVDTAEKKDAIEGDFKEQPAAVAAEIPPERAVEVMTSAHGLSLIDDPEKVVESARKAARAIVDVIKTKKKPVILNGEQYLEVEDWTLLGQMYGVSAKVREESIERVAYGDHHGWKCYADVIDLSTGSIVGGGSGLCMTDEPEWKERASYKWYSEKEAAAMGYTGAQILGRAPAKWPPHDMRVKVLDAVEPVSENARRSMAQTRAVSRALAIRLRFIPMLAGVKATPAEEMRRSGSEYEPLDDNPPADAKTAAASAAAPVAPKAPKAPMDAEAIAMIKARVKELGELAKAGNVDAAARFNKWNEWVKTMPGDNAAECYASLWANAEYTYAAKTHLGILTNGAKPTLPTLNQTIAAAARTPDQVDTFEAHTPPPAETPKWTAEDQKIVRETVKSIQKFKKEGGNARAITVLAEFGGFMDKHNLDWTGQNGRVSIWTKPELRTDVFKILELDRPIGNEVKVPDPALPFDPDAVPE